jgi:hypothetical protein
MRYMMLVRSDERKNQGPPDPKLMEAIGKLTEDMNRAGIVVATGGLLPSAAGAKVRLSRGKITVTDGPFSEAKELIGGYAILKAESKAGAIELARRFMQAHADALGATWDGEVEVRQLADFEPERA